MTTPLSPTETSALMGLNSSGASDQVRRQAVHALAKQLVQKNPTMQFAAALAQADRTVPQSPKLSDSFKPVAELDRRAQVHALAKQIVQERKIPFAQALAQADRVVPRFALDASKLSANRSGLINLTIQLDRNNATPWNIICYTCVLTTRGTAITREMLSECIANFVRYGGKTPVVLYHADTDPTAHPDSRKAHATIAELKLGMMERRGMPCPTLEARFDWINQATKADVASGALSRCSVTMSQNWTDEESGQSVGAVLHSLSLTNNPALTDLPALQA